MTSRAIVSDDEAKKRIAENAMLNRLRELSERDPDVIRKHVPEGSTDAQVLDYAAQAGYFRENLSDDMIASLEAIVVPNGRPVLLVKNDSIEQPDSETWRERIEANRDSIENNIISVGRIEVEGHPIAGYSPPGKELFMGTGFVVGENLLLTNRHVAKEFCNPDGSIKSGMSARIDFVEEYHRDPDNEFVIERCLEMGGQNDFDFAILQVRSENVLPPALPLANSRELVEFNQDPHCYVIGYPASDTRNDQDVQNRIFNGIYDVKRFAPGRVREIETRTNYFDNSVKDMRLHTDYTTLGGNSGSPVFDLETGVVIGLHYAGRYMHANYAVPIWSILHKVEKAKRLISGDSGSSPVLPDVTQPDEPDKLFNPDFPVFRSRGNAVLSALLKEKSTSLSHEEAICIAHEGFDDQSIDATLNACAAAIVIERQQRESPLDTLLQNLESVSPGFASLFNASAESTENGSAVIDAIVDQLETSGIGGVKEEVPQDLDSYITRVGDLPEPAVEKGECA